MKNIHQNSEITKIAERLRRSLASDSFPEDKKDALLEVLSVIETEASVSASHPELIEIAYPIMIEALGFQYGRGLHHAVRAIIESEERSNELFAAELNLASVDETLEAEVIQ